MKTMNEFNSWQAEAPAPPGNPLVLNVGQELSPANSVDNDWCLQGSDTTT